MNTSQYDIYSEALGDRGKWDTARVVSLMLVAFQVSTWGLELSLDLAIRTDGPVDLLNRPPPVISNGDAGILGGGMDWVVQVRTRWISFNANRTTRVCTLVDPPPSPFLLPQQTKFILHAFFAFRRLTKLNGHLYFGSQENLNSVDAAGTLTNFVGDELNGYATRVYRVGDSFVRGSKVFASWSTVPSNSPADLFYAVGGATEEAGSEAKAGAAFPIVKELACSTASTPHAVFISREGDGGQQTTEQWGTATECDAGPRLLNPSSADEESPPAIILYASNSSSVYVIAEEESSYPSFLYSVWRPVNIAASGNSTQPVEMHHVFYVSSTTRMAEAIVSGVVNDIVSGGGCVDLLSQFSITNTTYTLSGVSRVSPFGEIPSFSSVESIDQVEEIVAGVKVSDVGMISGLILVVVTGASFMGCLCSHFSQRPMDVFDRDAVIRAVALPGGEQEVDITSPALKIYVRRSDDARFGMLVSDDDTARRRWISRCVKQIGLSRDGSSLAAEDHNDDADDADTAAADDRDAGDAVQARGISRTWSLPRASFTRFYSNDQGGPKLDETSGSTGYDHDQLLSQVQTTSVQRPSGTFVEMTPTPITCSNNRNSVVRGAPTSLSASVRGWLNLTDGRRAAAGTHSRRNVRDQEHTLSGSGSSSMKNGAVDPALPSAITKNEATTQTDTTLSLATGDAGTPDQGVDSPPKLPAASSGARTENGQREQGTASRGR